MMNADLKILGKSEVKIPSIGMGTWGIGGWAAPDTSRDNEAIEAMQRGIQLGMWLIDTAEIYGRGYSEELVGKAIRDFARDQVFIVSKVDTNHLKYDDLIQACQRSLYRLRTEYIDLYLVHSPNYRIPLKETMNGMEELVKREMVRFIGVSNFPLNLMKEAQSYLNITNIQANQVKYNLKCRYDETDLLPYCQKEGITLMAYTPLEEGSLALNQILKDVGKEYGKTAAQMALNWLICQENVVTIPKAINSKHLDENAEAMGWRMAKQDFEKLSAAFA
ncbi:MAG: aldo/keto reductase [Dehalococcoidales bacterium]|nr:MAG: aldo/keto reductase [Dehalococcoidales bacterium]